MEGDSDWLLLPKAARRWKQHGSIVQKISPHLLTAELPVGDVTMHVVVFHWPHCQSVADRAQVIRDTHAAVRRLERQAPVLLLGDANGDTYGQVVDGVTGIHGQGRRPRRRPKATAAA